MSQNSRDAISNNDDAKRRKIVGGGIIAAIAIGFGVNAISPGDPNASKQDEPTTPIDSSKSPSPSVTEDATSVPTTGVTKTLKISVTASPSSVTASPSPSPVNVLHGSYFPEGRYGAGYYSTAYDVSFSSPMFQAGSGFYYGTSGYDSAVEAPHGYFSQSGWNGSGFYESGYYDLSGNYDFSGLTGFSGNWNGFTGYWDPSEGSGYYDFSGNWNGLSGSWDGTGITIPYGSGAYYGVSGHSDPTYTVRGSYFASGFAGPGNYATSLSYNYYAVSDYGNSWLYTTAFMGDGTYYGISGVGTGIPAPSGNFYSLGEFGSGYYSTGYYSCGYFQSHPTGASEWNYYFGKIGRRIYYGFSANAQVLYGFYGIYKNDGYAGSGYYEPDPNNDWDNQYIFGYGSYYGSSGYGSPISPPTGQWYYSGWGGSGFYSTGQMGSYWWEGIGTGAYYGSSGNSPAVDPT